METFENNTNIPEENGTNPPPASHAPQQDSTGFQAAGPEQYSYRGTGTGRRESPYANSPYVMNHRVEQQEQPRYRQSPYQNSGYQQTGFQQPGYQQPRQSAPRKPAKKEKNAFPRWKRVLAAVMVMLMVTGGCLVTYGTMKEHWEAENKRTVDALTRQIEDLQKQLNSVTAAGAVPGGIPAASGDLLSPSQVYAMNVASVVAISNQSTTNYFGQVSETASSGSGFILTEDGYVVSNYHVVSGATTLTVILHDGTEYPATLVGGDENNDIALLKVDATGLQAVTVGSSDALVVGDQVVAIGNPLGELTSTQTVGYISAKDRDITTDGVTINMMQTDAAINSGNSGGPLFNMKGEVVGITTAKYSGTSGSGATIEGIGFAIPIDDVLSMLSDLKEYGYVTGAYLGVSVRSMDAEVADVYGLPVGSQVDSVEDGSCAQKAGIQRKDIIVKLGDYEIDNNTDLLRALRKFKAGDTTGITVWRNGTYVDLTITLDEKPHEDPAEAPQETVPPTDPAQGSDAYGSWPEWFFGRGFGG